MGKKMEASESPMTKDDQAVCKRVEACEIRLLEKMVKMGEQFDEMKTQFADEFKSLENEIRFLKMKNEKLEEKVKSAQQGKPTPTKDVRPTTTTEKFIAVTSP